MSRGKHPPLPSVVRPVFWAFRVAGVLAGLAGLAIVAIASARGVWHIQLVPAVAAAFAFAALGWIHPLSKWFVPVLAACGVLVILAYRSWAMTLLIAATIGLLVWNRRPGRRLKSGVDPERIAIAEPTAVMKHARGFADGFKEAGFEQVGALRVPIGPVSVIVAVLLSPDARSYASVTDAVVSVTSLFADGKSLISRNSEVAPDPDYVLSNAISGASPGELVAAHSQALDLVGQRGHFPTTISGTELPQIALDGERRAIEWINRDRPTREQIKGGPLAERPDRYDLIDRWHGGYQV